ncbi:hypothetical protein BN1708_020753, partial [Verticillium longisporum]
RRQVRPGRRQRQRHLCPDRRRSRLRMGYLPLQRRYPRLQPRHQDPDD